LPEQLQRPRLLVADDDAGICTAVTRLLSSSCDIVGCAADNTTLFEAAARLRPDIVLLDFSLTGSLSAIEVCRRLKATVPDMSVVAFTGHDDDDLRQAAYDAGASSFVAKLRAGTDLLPAIRGVVERMRRRSEHNPD
jgi:two-component system, NarL family, response regulator NreC